MSLQWPHLCIQTANMKTNRWVARITHTTSNQENNERNRIWKKKENKNETKRWRRREKRDKESHRITMKKTTHKMTSDTRPTTPTTTTKTTANYLYSGILYVLYQVLIACFANRPTCVYIQSAVALSGECSCWCCCCLTFGFELATERAWAGEKKEERKSGKEEERKWVGKFLTCSFISCEQCLLRPHVWQNLLNLV